MADLGPQEQDEAPPRDLRRTTRIVGALVVLALVIVFVVQNTQTVPVHYFTGTGHPRFIWVVVGCLLVGVVAGMILGRMRRRRSARRRRLAHRHDG
ncbi:MAG TPA: lipopolysaccharide assembly protein LapA domain-containing protein [Acidimicrobiales bacterium]|nr:lipopolysaccharide assembly protein LapA domain-containing protein [Acidimicrobiales bacterium]